MTRVFVRRLVLGQFRSHRRASLDCDGRPVALYGPNGAGKTNLLEAVSLLSPGRGLRRAAPEDFAHGPGDGGWKLRAEIATPAGAREIETGASAGQSRSVRIDDKATSQLALGRVLAILWLTPAMDRLWIEGAEGRRRFLDRMVMSFTPEHGDAVLTYERAMRERNRLLRDQIDDPAWHGALEAQMAKAGAAICAHRRAALAALAGATADAHTAFPAADLALTGPAGEDDMAETATALAEALRSGRRRDMAAGRSLVGPHRTDLAAIFAAKGQPAAQCSTGEQKALLISLVLANARALRHRSGEAPVLLLDEVAAHLDATRRSALFDELVALDAQAWMTGTGPELFADLGVRAQRFEIGTTGIGGTTSRIIPMGRDA